MYNDELKWKFHITHAGLATVMMVTLFFFLISLCLLKIGIKWYFEKNEYIFIFISIWKRMKVGYIILLSYSQYSSDASFRFRPVALVNFFTSQSPTNVSPFKHVPLSYFRPTESAQSVSGSIVLQSVRKEKKILSAFVVLTCYYFKHSNEINMECSVCKYFFENTHGVSDAVFHVFF